MKQGDTDDVLRRAAPQVAPMGAERADRVLQNALATVPKRDSNHWRGRFCVVPLGAASVVAMMYFGVWNRPVAAPSPAADVPVVIPARVAAPPAKRIASVLPGRKPVVAVAASPVLPEVTPSISPRRKRTRRTARHTTVARRVLPAPPVAEPPTDADAPFLFVAATGTDTAPNNDESLTVTVRTDVPATVPGRAEVATVQSVVVPETADGDPAQDVPVWTHVAVETGQEPVMTLTALR